MGGKNDELTGYAIGFTMIMAALYFAFVIIAVIAGVVSFALTVIALSAIIDGDVEFKGERMTRAEGLAFISHGFAGMFCVWVVLFLIFSALGLDIDAMRWDLISVIGYALGSIGTECVVEEMKKEKDRAAAAAIPAPPPVIAEPPARPSNVIYPFASWRDED